MTPETIEGYGVRLRPCHPADVPEMVAGCADPQSRRFMPLLPDPYDADAARWWIAEGAPAAWAAGGSAYTIADPATDRLLGSIGLTRVSAERATYEIGYWVGPSARGRGVATAATRLLTEQAFTAGAGRLELLTHPENVPSQRIALACGYRHEGVRRAAGAPREGVRPDLVAWVRLAGDPPGPTARLLPDLPGGRLTDGVVALRRVEPADVDALHRLHTLREVVANRVPPVPPERAAVARRCRLAATRWLAGEAADLAILDATTGVVVGGCALFHDEPATGQAMVGYSLLPEARGRGLATRTVRLVAGWAFGIGVLRLWAGTRPDNPASQHVLERAGFRREGLLRGRLPGPDGSRVDSVVFGRLATDEN
ncbi:GNAT family N-acetyltransferase [Micromonospora sp. DT31]|uniref:GNAT family N-acetyltransferase n=1 Tax=Micromonospora sp. DT31 TaxID=3393434 RepID=UPI003CF15297